MSLLTSFDKSFAIDEGDFLDILPVCSKHLQTGHCVDFYNSFFQKAGVNSGFYKCPHGLSIYVMNTPDGIRIYPCLRRKEDHCKKKSNHLGKEGGYTPILPAKNLQALINHDLAEKEMKRQLARKEDDIRLITHDFKNLNAQIKQDCEVIFSLYPEKSDSPIDISQLLSKIREIMCCSTMIDGRFAMSDFEKAPENYLKALQFPCNVYKKFDKIRKLLSNYLHKHIKINLLGNSFKCITAYPSFEFLPFLILENAIKYSRNDDEIDVEFTEKESHLDVTISSFGPFCSPDEVAILFVKGRRGSYAKEVCEKGDGLGLYFVKSIADLHGIKINIEVSKEPKTRIDGIPYSDFKVILHFYDIFDEPNYSQFRLC